MSIHLTVSRIDRIVFVVVRGAIQHEDLVRCGAELSRATVPQFGKIIDVSMAPTALTKEQVRRVAKLVRGAARGSDVARVALVIDPAGLDLAHRLEQGKRGNNRVRSFRSLHEARRWITEPVRP